MDVTAYKKTFKSFSEYIREVHGLHYFAQSIFSGPSPDFDCMSNIEYNIGKLLNDKKPARILEIGTLKGVSSAYLSLFADVTTLDIKHYPETDILWEYIGSKDKIDFRLVRDDEHKAEIVNDLDFDFAFIDGMHSYESVKSDFNLVKKCGKVLFHDYYPIKVAQGNPSQQELIDDPNKYWAHAVRMALEGVPGVGVFTPFAYWEAA